MILNPATHVLSRDVDLEKITESIYALSYILQAQQSFISTISGSKIPGDITNLLFLIISLRLSPQITRSQITEL